MRLLLTLPALDGLPKDYARCAGAGIIGDDRYAIRIWLAKELHAEALMKGDRAQIGRCSYRFYLATAMTAGELDEMAEKVLCQMLSSRGCSDRRERC